jgi:hypothetical protein
LNSEGRPTGGFMPVSFDKRCRSCHSLEFDTHIQQEAPHTTPDKVRDFVTQQVTAFARAHPDVVAAEIRNWPAERMLPGKFSQGSSQTAPIAFNMPPPKSAQEWISNRVAHAEVILWREKCGLCHKDLNRGNTQATLTPVAMNGGSGMPHAVEAPTIPMPLPQIEPSSQPAHWFADAVFSHTAHQDVQCADCHQKALTSSSGSDLLLPAIATCRRCHDGQSSPQGPPVKTGHAESGCFLCHLYHGPQQGGFANAHRLADLVRR